MPNLRQGDSIGPRHSAVRPPNPRTAPAEARWLIDTSVTDCRDACVHASLEDLYAALNWCSDHPRGHRTRLRVIGKAIRRKEGLRS